MGINKNKVQPGQLKIIPIDNRLLDAKPYVNDHTTVPRWFKNITKAKGSLRSCAGVSDLLSLGVTLPLWTNVFFKPNAEHHFWESRVDEMHPSVGFKIEGFSHDATGKCPVTDLKPLDDYQYPKLVTPWKFETAPGWSTLILPTYWEPNQNYDVLPAVVHTDFYYTMNVVLNIKATESFKIPYGTPIAQLIPFKRNSDFAEVIFGDESEYKYYSSGGFGAGNIIPSDTSTAGAYRRAKHKQDALLKEVEDSSGFLNSIKKWRK